VADDFKQRLPLVLGGAEHEVDIGVLVFSGIEVARTGRAAADAGPLGVIAAVHLVEFRHTAGHRDAGQVDTGVGHGAFDELALARSYFLVEGHHDAGEKVDGRRRLPRLTERV